MKWSRSFLTAMIVTFILTAACNEQPSDIQVEDPGSEILAHTPPEASTAPLVASPPSYTQLEAAAVQQSGGSIQLSIDAAGDVPRKPDPFIESLAVFGYVWADLDARKAIVAVIHPMTGRDSKQNPDGWHTHTVELAEGTKASGGTSDFCIVSIGRSQAGIAIHSDMMRTHMALHWADLEVATLDVAASFVVQRDPGCAGSTLGVEVLDSEDL